MELESLKISQNVLFATALEYMLRGKDVGSDVMKLVDIIKAANKYYDDGLLTLEGYYDEDGKLVRSATGDTLARFIVIELNETYDEDASDEQQLAEAHRVIANGIYDLEMALQGIEEMM